MTRFFDTHPFWARLLFAFALVLAATYANSQNVRWDLGAPGSAGAVAAGGTGLSPLFAQPGAILNFCNYPANAIPCTNYANTYPTLASTTPCPTNQQVVLQGSSTCQSTGDNFGNMGVYTVSGTYAYTLTVNGVASGPYTLTLDVPSTGAAYTSFVLPNDAVTGTTLNTLTKLNGSPNSTVVIMSTTDTTGFVGIVTAGAGTTGDATIQSSGLVKCVFSNATTVNDYVQRSGTTGGNCLDTGSTVFPTSGGDVIGRVLSTNASPGTYQIDEFAPELVPGSSGSGGGNPTLDNCTPDESGFTFYSVTSLTNYFAALWQFCASTSTCTGFTGSPYINCTIYIPTAATGATIVLDIAANDGTAGHTANFQTCDGVINSGTINTGSLTCAAAQTFTTTSTAYNRVTLTFNVQSTLSNGSILVVKILTSTTGTAPTANMLVYPHFVL
jgi:hypothetical protein